MHLCIIVFIMAIQLSTESAFKTKLNELKTKLPEWLKNTSSLFYYFWFLVLIGVLFFATSLFVNYFTTPFTGDYCAQQFAFYLNGYDDWWHFFKTGEFALYDTNTFLGANNIGSNSFYYLFDPFFMPILLFPRAIVPQGMAILTIFKIAASGMTFYVYIRYLGASRRSAKITGLAYAFSGWMTWYLWFNHFTSVAIVLPLILYGVEKVLREKNGFILAASLALMGFVNYFFLVCFIICAFLYAIFRFIQRIKLNSLTDNFKILGIGIGFAIVGVLSAALVIFPSAMVVLESSRAQTNSYATNLLEAFKEQNLKEIFALLTDWGAVNDGSQYETRNDVRPFYFIMELIYPVTTNRGTPLLDYNNMYGSYDNVAGSLYCYIPMLVLFVPAFIRSMKEKKFSVIIPVVFFIVGVQTPFLYYALFGFTQAYSRWFLFFTISLLAYVGLYLNKFKEDKIWTFDVGAAFIFVLAIIGGVFAIHIANNYGYTDGNELDYFTARVPAGLAMGLMCAYIVLFWIVIRLMKTKQKPKMMTCFTGFIVVEIALMGAFTIQGHGVENYLNTNKGLYNNLSLNQLVTRTSQVDKSYYRSYSSLQSSDAINDGMKNGYNGTSFFHSSYNYNIDDFKNWTRISTGSWSGVYNEKRINTDTFLGTKYYYIQDDYLNYYQDSRKATMHENFTYNVPLGYVDISDSEEYNFPEDRKFKVYRNELAVNFGFSFDKIIDMGGNSFGVMPFEDKILKYGILNTSEEDYEKLEAEEIAEQYPDIEFVPSLSLNSNNDWKQINLSKHDVSNEKHYPLTYYDIHSKKDSNGKYRNSIQLSMVENINLNDDLNSEYGYAAGDYPDFSGENEYSRYTAVIEFPTLDSAKTYYNPNGMIFYIPSDFKYTNKTDIYFVTTDDKIITYDNHNDTNYSTDWSDKKWRAFYIHPEYGYDSNGDLIVTGPAPQIKKIICVSRNYTLPRYSYFYVDSFDNYLDRLSMFNENPITDVYYTTNTFKFKTNYDKNRLIVSQLPFEEGWTVKIKDSQGNVTEPKIYKAQGGFVSFVSGKGECSYEMTFYPPGLRIGSYLSALGAFTFISTLFGYGYVSWYLKEKHTFEQEMWLKKRR